MHAVIGIYIKSTIKHKNFHTFFFIVDHIIINRITFNSFNSPGPSLVLKLSTNFFVFSYSSGLKITF